MRAALLSCPILLHLLHAWAVISGEELTRTALSTSHMHMRLEGEEPRMLRTEAAHVLSTTGWTVVPWEAAGAAAHLAAEVCGRHVQDESCKLVPLDCVIGVRVRSCTGHALQINTSTFEAGLPAALGFEVGDVLYCLAALTLDELLDDSFREVYIPAAQCGCHLLCRQVP